MRLPSMSKMSEHQRFALSNGYRLQNGPEGEGYLLYPEGIVHLNDSAFAILRRIDAQETRSGILAALQREFDIIEQDPEKGFADMKSDLDQFLHQALADRWIEELP